jgi:hypothetical protein
VIVPESDEDYWWEESLQVEDAMEQSTSDTPARFELEVLSE